MAVEALRRHRAVFAYLHGSRADGTAGPGSGDSRKKSEGLDMARTDEGEATAVDGRDLTDAQPFCRGYHRGVYGAKRQVSVSRNEFSDPQPIAGGYRLDDERAIGQVAEESHLGFDAQPATQ